MYQNRKRKKRLRTMLLALLIGLGLVILMPEITAENGILQKLEELLGIAETGTVHIEEDGDGLLVQVFDVGEGLAILMKSRGECMLFDGGGREASALFLSDLKSAGVTKIDYMVASHFDADHAAGLVDVLGNYKVGQVYAPSYDAGTWTYQSFMRAVSDKGLKVQTPQRGDTFTFGSCSVTCLSTPGEEHEQENDYSIVLRVVCGERSILLTGDATWVTEQDILNTDLKVKSDILVVGHHGSNSSSDAAFLQAVDPRTAVISVGADNEYGHPGKYTMDRLETEYIHVLRTDLQGMLKMYTDGKAWAYEPEPCNDYSFREQAE